MKLSKLYSNKSNFKSIKFNDGFNLILGVGNKLSKNNSHNLGKTTVAVIIDFLLLKQLDKNQKNFLVQKKDKFKGYIFFLELKLNSGNFLTIKREVGGKISIKKHVEEKQNYINETEWDYEKLGLQTAVKTLEELLNFDVTLKHRQFLKFIIRTQFDYAFDFKKQEVRDKDWKLPLLKLLGYDYESFKKVLSYEEKVKECDKQLEGFDKEYFKKLEDKKQLKRIRDSQIERMSKELEKYNYYELDDTINDEIINNFNESISKLNKEKYNLSYDVKNIGNSLKTEINTIDIETLETLFSEVNIYFKDSLKKDYEALLEFNRQISTERVDILTKKLAEKKVRLIAVENDLIKFNKKQNEAFKILESNKILDKILLHMNELEKYKTEVAIITKELELMKSNIEKNEKKKKYRKKQNEEIDKLAENINTTENILKNNIDAYFRTYTEKIFYDVTGSFNVYTNLVGKPNFELQLMDKKTLEETAESNGQNYNKHLKCCFDLALIESYVDKNFYRFLYHDGSIEASDNKIKKSYIELVKELCEKTGIQYITTSISDEIASEEIKKLIDEKNDIVLTLNDSEDYSGTLFGMKF